MSVKYGLDAKIYYDVAGVADDVWTELTRAREVTLSSEITEADLTTRANGGWEATGGKLRKGSVELQIPWDPADAGFEVFEDAYFGDTVVGVACMDGSILGTTPAKGLKADMHVLKFERAEPLDGVQMASVTVKPTYSLTAPNWWTTLVRALPTQAETVVSDYIALGPGTAAGTIKINAPALTTTELPDAQTMKYTLQTDDNAAFTSPTALVSDAITQTGAAGAGAAAASYSYTLPGSAQRYLRLSIVKSGAGSAATKNGRLSLLQ